MSLPRSVKKWEYPDSISLHTSNPELPEIRNAYHSVLVSLLPSADVVFLCVCFCELC